MSTEEEKFDALLRSKMDENHFEFNEANWEKAEAAIILAGKKRKRKRFGVIFIIGLLIGVGIMTPFVLQTNAVAIKKTDPSKSNDSNQGGVAGDKTAERLNGSVDSETQEKTSRQVDETTKKTEHFALSEQEKSVDEASRTSSSVLPEAEKLVVAAKAQKNTLSEPGKAFPKDPKEETYSEKKNQEERVKSDSRKSYQEKLDPVAGINSLLNSPNRTATNKHNQNNGLSVNKQKKPNEDSDATDVRKSEATSLLEKSDKMQQVPFDLQVLPSLKISKVTEADTFFILRDSLFKLAIDTLDTISENGLLVLKPTNILTADVGSSYGFGWSNLGIKEASGFNPLLGISFTHFFTQKIAGLIAAQYTSLGHLNYSHYTQVNTQYDFGLEQTKTVITPTVLYYIAMPLQFQYYLNHKNSFTAGVNTLFLLYSNGMESIDQGNSGGIGNFNTVVARGYRDGFTPYDIQGTLGYRLQLGKKLLVCAEGYYGFINCKNNAFFGLQHPVHNTGIKLTLSYYLWRK